MLVTIGTLSVLSTGTKKVAISGGSTVLPIQIASLSMYNYYFTYYIC